MLINYSFEVNNLLQHNHLFHYNFRKFVFISLNHHISDDQNMIWTNKGHMFWATNRHILYNQQTQFRGYYKADKGKLFYE